MSINYSLLINEAQKAISKGFYAKRIPQKRYGAAVLTDKGNIYTSGQYSSFNHITSIHAEMGAILCATMNNDPNIIALALTSTFKESIRCCGVCLQFIKEHCKRTGIDMEIIYDGNEIIHIKQSVLTNNMW